MVLRVEERLWVRVRVRVKLVTTSRDALNSLAACGAPCEQKLSHDRNLICRRLQGVHEERNQCEWCLGSRKGFGLGLG